MKPKWMWGCILVVSSAAAWMVLALFLRESEAQYRPPPYVEEEPTPGEKRDRDFHRAVDLNRFRKGNFEWDTQELIASGFKALHREHEEILKELKALRAEIAALREE